MCSQEIIKVQGEELRKFIVDILIKNRLSADDSIITANHLVKANLRGVDTHGIIRLKGYIDRINSGGNNTCPNIKILREKPFSAVIDGDNSLGQVGGKYAMELAIKKAKKNGIGMVSMCNSNHYGMAGYYSMMPLAYDMIGISMTNVLACIAPTGGTVGRVGNNPISIAFPANKEFPVVLDIATSKSSWGKALVCKQKGEPLPEDCFMDSKGKLTLDPEAFLSGGTLIPIAGYKGYGLALIISCFCSLLADGKFDTSLPHLYKKLGEPGENSFFMAAIKIDNFASPEHFKKRMDETIRVIKSTPTARNVDKIYLPGEIEFREEQKRKQNGIPLNKTLVLDLVALAQDFNMEISSYKFLSNIN